MLVEKQPFFAKISLAYKSFTNSKPSNLVFKEVSKASTTVFLTILVLDHIIKHLNEFQQLGMSLLKLTLRF